MDRTGTAGGHANTTSDIVAIQQVLNRYPHAVDERDWESFAGVFTDDVVCDMRAVGLGVTDGLAALIARFDDIEHPVAHHLINPVIDVVSPEAATSRSKWLVVLADRSALSGNYTDDLRRTTEGWRVHRRLITDGQAGSRRPVAGYDEGSVAR